MNGRVSSALKRVPLWPLLLAVLVGLFAKSQGVDPMAQIAIRHHLASVRELLPMLDQQVLHLRYDMATDYDRLVALADAVTLHQTALRQSLTDGRFMDDGRVEAELVALERATRRKLDAIEAFKSHNAVLKSAVQLLMRDRPAGVDGIAEWPASIAALQRNLLRVMMGGQESSLREQIARDIADLERRGAPGLDPLLLHAKTVLAFAPKVDGVVAQIGAGHAADGLADAYNRRFGEQLQSADGFRTALFVAALGILLWAGASHLRLRERSEELRAAERELDMRKHAVDQHAIVSVTDVNGAITEVNGRFCAISGYPEQELLGQDHRILTSASHDPEFFQALWRSITQGDVWHGQIRNRAKDGRHYWVDSTIVPFPDEDGKPHRYMAIGTDITRQKDMDEAMQRQQRFVEVLTENIGDGVYAQDVHGRCVFMNSAAERLLGWSRSDLIGRKIHDAIHYQDGEGNPVASEDCPMLQSVRADRVYRSDDECFTRRDGTLFPLCCTSVPVYGDGRFIGMVVIIRDTTLLKQKELELRSARQQADEATQTQGMFLANIGEELRTPMNAIVDWSDRCLQTELDARQRDYVAKIHGAGEHLLAIANDILDFSKIDAGRLGIADVDFNLDQVAAGVAHAVAEKGIAVKFTVSPHVPRQLNGDAPRLGQVLTNLLGHAAKFTGRGDIDVAVELLSRRLDGVSLQFSVRDMSQDQCDRLFQSFMQADGAIGLAVSKHLVELMGGEISVTRAADVGSCIAFALPLKSREAPPKSQPQGIVSRKILIVDDDAAARDVLMAALRTVSSEVSMATKAAAGIAMVRASDATEPFDVVFMDWVMPDLNAMDACKLLRDGSGLRHPPHVIVTAADDTPDIAAAKSSCLADLLTKPVTEEAVLAALSRLYPQQAMGAADVTPQPGLPAPSTDDEVHRPVARETPHREGVVSNVADNAQKPVTAGVEEAPAPIDSVVLLREFAGLLRSADASVVDFVDTHRKALAGALHDRHSFISLIKEVKDLEFDEALEQLKAAAKAANLDL